MRRMVLQSSKETHVFDAYRIMRIMVVANCVHTAMGRAEPN